MVHRCLALHLLTFWADRAAGLAQVSASRGEHLALHELGAGTALHNGGMRIADVDTLGNVGVQPLEVPIGGYLSTTGLYGSIMFTAVNPSLWGSSARAAVNRGVKVAAEESGALTSATVSLIYQEQFPDHIKINFETHFALPAGRQAFVSSVMSDRGKFLMESICEVLPWNLRGNCVLITEQMSLAEAESQEVWVAPAAAPICYGSFTLKPQPLSLLQDPNWQESVAISIAFTASVSRLQVGTLMAVEGDAVRVNFWFRGLCANHRATAARYVVNTNIAFMVEWYMNAWHSSDQEAEFPVYGRMVLQVPSPQNFASNQTVAALVDKAVEVVAAQPSPEVKFNVTSANVSLTTMSGSSGAVRLGFQVAFDCAIDRQVFADDFALDQGAKLANRIKASVRSCNGLCRLPGQQQTPVSAATFGKRFAYAVTFLTNPRPFVNNNRLQDAMALAVSDLALIPVEQVGIMTMNNYGARLNVHIWAVSSNETLRQVVAQRMELAGQPNFWRCTLAELDKLHSQGTTTSTTPRPTASPPTGTMLVYTLTPERYITETAREQAAMKIANVASVSRAQVGVSVTVRSPVLASISFWVISTNSTFRQVAVDRVNSNWDASDLRDFSHGVCGDFPGPVFMVGGGTTAFKQADRFQC